MEENSIKEAKDKKGKLSIYSLIFFIIRFLSLFPYFIAITASKFQTTMLTILLQRLIYFPWTIISLILAIIGRNRDKDKLSKVMIILNIIVLVFIAGITIFLIGIMIFTLIGLLLYGDNGQGLLLK